MRFVRTTVSPVGLGLILLVTGCDRLLGLSHQDPPAADAPRSATTLVQQQPASNAGAWMLAATLDAPPTSGNLLVVIGATDRSFLRIPSGGGVSTWARAAASVTYADVEIWYGVSDGSSSTVTITCDCPMTTLGNMRLSVSEWSGLATSNVLDGSNNATGSATTATTATTPITTLAGPDLLIFGIAVVGPVAADVMDVGSWTALESIAVGTYVQSQWYQVVTEPGTHMPGVTVGGTWDAAIAAFRMQP